MPFFWVWVPGNMYRCQKKFQILWECFCGIMLLEPPFYLSPLCLRFGSWQPYYYEQKLDVILPEVEQGVGLSLLAGFKSLNLADEGHIHASIHNNKGTDGLNQCWHARSRVKSRVQAWDCCLHSGASCSPLVQADCWLFGYAGCCSYNCTIKSPYKL